jgi:hypothetical protein
LALRSDGQSLSDQATGNLDVAAPENLDQLFQRWQANANATYQMTDPIGGRHDVRFGCDFGHVLVRDGLLRTDDLTVAWNSVTGRGTEVTLSSTPVVSRSAVDMLSFFAQETFSIKRLSVAGGVRVDRLEGYFPEQESGASRWFPTVRRSFDEIRDIVKWTNLAPRVSAVYDLRGNGRTALKASAGRYNAVVGTLVVNTANPNTELTERYAWNDNNGDLRFQPGEAGQLLGRAGGVTTQFDPEIKRPHTNEVTVGVDHELMPALRLSVLGIYRGERDNFGFVNVGVPFSSYIPVSVVDPGRDGFPGTSDDIPNFVVYAQDRATLGQDRFLQANHETFDSSYKGFEVTATKRMTQKWEMVMGYTRGWEKDNTPGATNLGGSTGTGPRLTSPNDLINASGPSTRSRRHQFKVSGIYLLPHDIGISANFRSQSGQPIARTARFTLPQGSVLVNVDPRGREELEALTTIDFRIGKRQSFGNGRSFEVYAELDNLTNANTVLGVRTLTGRINLREGGIPTGQLLNQQQHLSPTSILPPRLLKIGFSVDF